MASDHRDMFDTSKTAELPAAALAVMLLSSTADPSCQHRRDLESIAACLPSTGESSGVVEWLAQRKIDSLLYLGDRNPRPRQRLYDLVWARQRDAAEQIARALSTSSIPVIIFKGADIVSRYFGTHAIGFLDDIDILVPKECLDEVAETLKSLGYCKSIIKRGPLLVDWKDDELDQVESGHYELAPFWKMEEVQLDSELIGALTRRTPLWMSSNGSWFVGLNIDLHHGVATNVPGTPFFERSRPSVFPDAAAMNASDLLWLTVSRYYTEVALNGKRSLRDFSYVLSLLSREEIDWDVVLRAQSMYSLGAALHYYLAFAERIFPGVVPCDVLDSTNPRVDSSRFDWGWQLEQLFSVGAPFPLDQQVVLASGDRTRSDYK